jgi:hypothetical protein
MDAWSHGLGLSFDLDERPFMADSGYAGDSL